MRELERVDAGAARARRAAPSRAARRRLRSARGSRGRGCRRRAARRSRRRCIVTRPRSGRSISSGSYRRTAVTSWRCASWPSARSQPGALMKSETTKTLQRRLIDALRRRAAARAGRSRRRAASAGRAAIRCSRCSTCTAAAARRDHGVDVVAVEQRADAVAVARQQPREHARRTRARRVRLVDAVEPKSTLALKVDAGTTRVSSRSSVNWRT